MNALARLLSAEDIRLDWDVSNKLSLLDHVARLFEQRHGLSGVMVYRSLLEREEWGSTALGHGVAIPHARIPDLREPVGALIRTRYAIPFGAPDEKPVFMLVVLLVPDHANKRHLELLASAAAIFSDRGFREQFSLADDVVGVLRLLSEWSLAR